MVGDRRPEEGVRVFRDVARAVAGGLAVFAGRQRGAATDAGVGEAVHLLGMLCSVADTLEDPDAVQQALFGGAGDVIPLLVAHLTEELVFAPGVTSAGRLEAEFCGLRAAALHALAHLADVCSGVVRTPEASAVPHRCPVLLDALGAAILEAGGVEAVLSCLSATQTAPANQLLREAAAHCLHRCAAACPALLAAVAPADGVPVLLDCLGPAAPSAAARAAASAVVARLAPRHFDQLVLYDCSPALLWLLRHEPSPAVKAQALGILAVIFDAAPEAVWEFPRKAELAEVIPHLLEADPPAELSTAALRLLAALCDLEAPGDPDGDRDGEGEAGPPFAGYLAAADAHGAVVRHLQGPPAVAIAAAAALRSLASGCPDLGPRLLGDFDALALLLATLAALPDTPAQQPPEDVQRDVALALGLMLAAHPASRDLLRAALGPYPQWAAEVRAALLRSLSAVDMQRYASLPVRDCSNEWLNVVARVGWLDAHRPQRASVEALFSAQEARHRVQPDRQWDSAPAPTPFPADPADADRQARLTYVVLCYAVHLSLPAQDHGWASSSAPPTAPLEHELQRRSSDPAIATDSRRRRATSAPPRPREQPLRLLVDSPKHQGGQPGGTVAGLPPAEGPVHAAIRLVLSLAHHYDWGGRPLGAPTGGAGGRPPGWYLKRAPDWCLNRVPPDPALFEATKRAQLRVWTVADVRHGDLFDFAVPLPLLTADRVAACQADLGRYVTGLRKRWLTTPQAFRSRRWFLQDVLQNVAPVLRRLLDRLGEVLTTHAAVDVQAALRPVCEDAAGRATLHPGNLLAAAQALDRHFPPAGLGAGTPGLLSLELGPHRLPV